MGQSASLAADQDDRRHGFSAAEYAKLQERLSMQGSGSKAHLPRVELADFVSCFPAHLRSFVQPLFCYLGKERVGEGSADWDHLVQGVSRAIKSGLRWKELLEVWADRDAIQDGETSFEGPELELCLELAVSLCFWAAFSDRRDLERSLSPDLAVAVLKSSVKMDFKSLASWLEGNLPMLPNAVGFCLSQSLLGEALPAIPEINSRILEASTHLLLRSCTARLWESDEWMPLYRDWCDGRSFNALLKGTLFYEAPAVVLLQTQQGHVLGGLSTVWTDNNGKYAGSTECWLFALQPAFTVCKSTSSSGNYAYLNSRNKYAPRGLGFGGQEGFFRLWIDADFEECYVLESDATYAPGLLHPSSGSLQIPFQLAAIEVWGCGGLEAAKLQKAHRERVEGVREQARKVDKARLCDNEFDKEMFLGNTFSATADCREVVEHKKAEEAVSS